jgi:hypothetical protein
MKETYYEPGISHIHPGNFQTLKEVYQENLDRNVKADPAKYSQALAFAGSTETMVENTFRVIDRLGINGIDINVGETWKQTCKELGIKHTYKAIKEFLS